MINRIDNNFLRFNRFSYSARKEIFDSFLSNDIENNLKKKLPLFQIISWVNCTGSTNTDLLEFARRNRNLRRPWLRGSFYQKSGRGRFGNQWVSKNNSTIMFSCAFDIDISIMSLKILPILTSLSICENLRKLAKYQTAGLLLKWPNDIQWYNAKLAGVLIEILSNSKGYIAIIGIGINISNANYLSKKLDRLISDWSQVIGSKIRKIDIINLIYTISDTLYNNISVPSLSSSNNFCARFNKVDALSGCFVKILGKNQILLRGIARGVNSQGDLILETSKGIILICISSVSDISII